MKSKLFAARLADQNESSFLDALRKDDWFAGDPLGLSGTGSKSPTPQTAVGPVPQNAVPPTVSLTTSGVAYTQNFDTLSNTAGSTTNNLTINGWTFTETGGGARDNEQYAVDTGGSNTGDTFSYGIAASTERALGQLRSGTLISTIGASFTNNTGSTISSLQITYDGEQWRFGGVHTTADRLNFQISFNATSVDDGAATWTDVDALDFAPPITTGTAGALDGNAAANRVAGITSTISSLTIANGASFWIRWVDVDAIGGGDDGLAIDNFSITPTADPAPGELSIGDVTLAEGNSGTTAFSFTVTRANGSSGAVGATWTLTAPGGAGNADSGDFDGAQLITGTVSFADGDTSETITINVQGDLVIEGNEAFTVTLSAPTGGATITDATGAGSITNDDAAGAISVADVSLAEGDAGTTVGSFAVTRIGGVSGTVSVDYLITLPGGVGGADGSDVSGSLSGTVTFLEGETSKTIDFDVNGDVTFEPDETFTVALSNAQGGATIGDGSGTATITNDDAAPAGTLSIDDVSLAEGDSGPTTFTFTVTRSGGSAGAVTADYTIAAPGGAGNADSADFVSGSLFSGQVSFANGELSKTITIDVEGDTAFEADEAFTVTLSNPTGGATIGDGTGAGTIQNDDPQPSAISIGDASLVEGNDGVTYLVFTVSLDIPSAGTVTVNYQTANGSATAGSDYLGLTGQVTFSPGDTSETISVPLIGDFAPENNETLTVTLSSPSANATIADGSATGTITNDDGAQYYSLASGSFTQDWTNTGQITANDNWSGVPYIIGYLGDIDGGSTTNVDARTLTGANLGAIDVIANLANTTSNSGGVGEFHIANPVVGLQGSGTADAPSIVLYMDATGRSSVRLQANLRDIDNSAPGGTEDNAAQQINVQYRTSATGTWTNVPGAYFADVTALGASQVTALDVTLPAGADNAATLEIRIMTTNAAGNDEWVGIDDIIVSSQVSAPSLSIANAAVFEGDAGAATITFTVTRSGSSTGAVTADWTAVFGSGAYDAEVDDFTVATPLAGQVSFADGQTSATITLSVDGDIGPEVDENFTITLSNPSAGATIADGTATGTIVNDDGPPPLVTINDVSVVEGDSGTVLMTFTVTRTGGTGAFAVDWQTSDGSATAGSDYLAASGTVNFADGQMSDTVTVAVTVNGDTDSELSETLQITLSNATNFAVITDAVGIGTIASDDPIYIHDIQGTAYFSPILAGEGISGFNVATAGTVIVRAVVTAVDNDGSRQGFYLQEELADWDANPFTSEGIFVFTGATVSGVNVGDIVTVTAHVMEFQGFASNMPVTTLTSPTSIVVNSTGNPLPSFTLGAMPTAIMTLVQPDYTDSSDGAGDTFDASLYALSYWETVEGMLVTMPDVVVADGFVTTSGGQPIFQAYSSSLTDADQINSRGGLTIAGDPPIGPPDTAGTEDDTTNGGRALTDGDINPDLVEIDFSGFAIDAPAGLGGTLSMGDELGDVTGIIEFDFTDRKLFVTDWNPGDYVDNTTTQETTSLGNDSRALTVATFNVENLDPGDGAARFTAIANVIANNLNAPDIICIEEMQDNNGATASGGADASTTWQMLVTALNLATGANYQWVDQEPVAGAEGGEPGGNIRVGFLYNTDRVQLGDLDASASLTERRQYTDRIGDGVRDAGDLIAFDDSMLGAEIQTGDWAGTRRSLLGEFTFNGNIVYVTANHFPAKGGSDDFWEFNQNPAVGEPTNSGWTQRNNDAQDVYAMLNLIEQNAPGSGIVSGGDYNDFYFYRPMTTVTGYTMADGTARVGGARFENLTLTLTEAERYTYNFDGRSQAIDHIVVNGTLGAVATYDVVHLNTGFNPASPTPLSDHDPGLASFDFRNLAENLRGTAGADIIEGGGGGDTIRGVDGNDALDGGDGDDTLFGGNGDDIVVGGAGYDVLVGEDGADFLGGGSGAGNEMIGGDGDDVYYVTAPGDTLVEQPGEGTDRVLTLLAAYSLEGLPEIEDLAGLSGTGHVLTGNDADNVIVTVGGDDVLSGGLGRDVLIGDGGADLLIGGDGLANELYGGAGDDTYVVTAADTVVELPGEGIDTVRTSLQYYVLQDNVENLVFIGSGDFVGIGNGAANTLVGGAGNDRLTDGGGAADTLIGGDGDDTYVVTVAGDTIVEQAVGGNDTVETALNFYQLNAAHVENLTFTGTGDFSGRGNAEGNVITGGAGDDLLAGGLGGDTLVGNGGANDYLFDTALGGGNVDTIVFFAAGGDKMLLDDGVFAALSAGGLAPGAFMLGTTAQDADDRILYDSATGALYYDADGNGAGAAVQFATLSNAPLVTASDFIVI